MVPENKKKVEWLKAGKSLFAENGASGLNIDILAEKVGKAKTSLYYLFGSKDAFLLEIVKYWMYTGTYQYFDVIKVIEEPNARFTKLVELIYEDREDGIAWLQIRKMANTDPQIKTLCKIYLKCKEFIV